MKKICAIFSLFILVLSCPNAYSAATYPLEKMMREHGVYDSYAHLDSRLPKVQVSDFHLMHICELVISAGYNYFTITKHKGKYQQYTDDDGRSDYALDQFGLKKISVIKKDKNEFSSDFYVWDAFELLRKIRKESGYRAQQDEELARWNEELKQSPDDRRLLSLIGLILEGRSRYENEGFKDYYENLYQIIDVQIRNGESPNPNGELGRFMDASICADNESKYLGVLARLSDGDRSKVDSKKQYDSYKSRLKNDPNEKYNFCRRYL